MTTFSGDDDLFIASLGQGLLSAGHGVSLFLSVSSLHMEEDPAKPPLPEVHTSPQNLFFLDIGVRCDCTIINCFYLIIALRKSQHYNVKSREHIYIPHEDDLSNFNPNRKRVLVKFCLISGLK